jgi:hypothetical protein
MKSLIAAAVTILVATPAYAERYYLISTGRTTNGVWSVSVPMKSVEQCETAGLKLQAAGQDKKLTGTSVFVGYECILGD